MAAVAHAHGLGVGGQGQLVAGARVAEDVATVAAVVLGDRKVAVRGCQPPGAAEPLPGGRYQVGRASEPWCSHVCSC